MEELIIDTQMDDADIVELVDIDASAESLLNARDVAELLNVHISWVKNHCTRTEPILPFVQFGEGTRRFRKEDILQFIEEHFCAPRKRD